MKEYLTIEQVLGFYRELDEAELFDQLDYLDSLWEPMVGQMVAIELWRKNKVPVVISKLLSVPGLFLCYNPRIERCNSYYRGDSVPLFSIGQLINILGIPQTKYNEKTGMWDISVNHQTYSEFSLCDALWEAVKDKVKKFKK